MNTDTSDKKIEIVSVIMLGIIMVGIAYSAYEAHLWGSIQTFLLRDVNKDSLLVAKNELQQDQKTSVEAMVFSQYSNAVIRKDTTLAKFYYDRFTPEMKVAVDAWLKTDPFNNTSAPLTPFVMPEYNKTHAMLALQFEEQTNNALKEAQQASEYSGNYVFLSVMFSTALFIDGIVDRAKNKKIQLTLLAIVVIITVTAAVLLIELPTAVSH